jgi:hypothetical protein
MQEMSTKIMVFHRKNIKSLQKKLRGGGGGQKPKKWEALDVFSFSLPLFFW